MDPNNTQNVLNSNLLSAIIGALVTIVIFVIGNIINAKRQKKNDIKDLIILLTQTNQKLFSLIYQGSLDCTNIDYLGIRNELENTSIIYILPNDLRKNFMELYKIYFTDPTYYDDHKCDIYERLKSIINVLNSYEVYLFDK